MHHVELDKIRYLLKRIQARLQATINSRWPVGFSIGVVVFTEIPVSVDAVIAQVDQVMYSIKKSGRNRLELKMAQFDTLTKYR